jgi:hypothetical protein
MAGSIATGPAPAPTSDVGSQFNLYLNVTTSLAVVLGGSIVAAPPAVLGMGLAYLVWKVTNPTRITAVVLTVGAAISLLILNREVLWFWPLGLVIPGRFYDFLPVTSAVGLDGTVWRSCAIELLAGPVLYLTLDGLLGFREKTLVSGLYRQAPRTHGRGGRGGWDPAGWFRHYDSPMAPLTSAVGVDLEHPKGVIRLGLEKDSAGRRAFDLTSTELRTHVFIPGASGSGKTTTLARLADGALGNGFGLVIVDCKGSGLGATARMLATRHGLPFYVVDPDAPSETLGYNPCRGSPSDVANKLIGAFAFGEAGEIYKQVAMNYIPILVRGLQAAGTPVTLASLAKVCDQNEMGALARKAGQSPSAPPDLQEQLLQLAAAEGVGKAGSSSLQHRFGALLQGKFGDLFLKDEEHSLDWDAVLERPSVVYLALSATAAPEDVELLGRVIAQDLKQVCGRRLRAAQSGSHMTPVLLAFDEFAALREAGQITDLLLQARQADMPIILSTQYLPEAIPIRKAALQAGLLVIHRLEAKDAEDVAAQFGTRSAWKVTHQIEWETGRTEKGSIRDIEEYNVHPNTLRRLAVGEVAVRSVPTDRHALVRVIPVERDGKRKKGKGGGGRGG